MSYDRENNIKLDPVMVILGINSIIFLVMLFFDNNIFYANLGLSLNRLDTQPWTIVTALFVHINFWHIVGNMLTLYFFGTFVESLVGNRKMLLAFLGGGIAGNLLYLLYAYFLNSGAVLVGASGAVYALGGVLVAMRPNIKVMVFPIPAPVPLWAAVVGSFLIMFLFPGVSWQAHLGGLMFGLIIGYFFHRRESKVSWHYI